MEDGTNPMPSKLGRNREFALADEFVNCPPNPFELLSRPTCADPSIQHLVCNCH